MKATTSFLTGLLVLAAGIVLIICNKLITQSGIITVAGILFVLTGIINLILYVNQKDENGKPKVNGITKVFGWLVSLAAMILGLCMLIFNPTFARMVPFIFGILILFGGVVLIYALVTAGKRYGTVSGWLYIFPAALVILALVVFFQNTTGSDSRILILTGSALLTFGVGCFVTGMVMAMGAHRIKKGAGDSPVDVKDVKAIEDKETKDAIKGLDD